MAYISFALTLLFFFGISLINHYFSKPHRGEDGMALGTILGVVLVGFFFSSLVLALSIWWKGGFDWVSPQAKTRNVLVGIGWIGMVLVIFDSSFFESGWYHNFPDFIRSVIKSLGQIWIPLLMFFSIFFLLNVELKTRVLPYLYKAPMSVAFGLSALMVLGMMVGWVQKKIEHKMAVREARQEEIRKYGGERSWYFQTSMDFIHAHHDSSITRLLSYTIKNKDRDKVENEEIRKAAVAKIKSYENWETSLMNILEQKEISEIYNAYGFLEENKLEQPDKFILALQSSMTYVTSVAQESIQNSDNYFLGSTNISALCQILESQFKENASTFRPAMEKLQRILELQPSKRSDPKYAEGFTEILERSRKSVKTWLESNQ